jgi:hypothetical protein
LQEAENDSESQQHGRKTSKVIIFGDSLLKFTGEACKTKGHDVHCFQGIRLEELQHQVEKIELKTECPDVMVIHGGTKHQTWNISH